MEKYLPLSGKTILAGITGGISAYKAAHYLRQLTKLGCRIIPVMTQNATKFITPLTISALTGEKTFVNMFNDNEEWKINHINLARQSDLMVILPATANFIAKAANGVADDLLSTLFLAFNKRTVFFPAMNPQMLSNPVTQRNIKILREFGHNIVECGGGSTACGENGKGRLPAFDVIKEEIIKELTPQTLKNIKILVTAGPTRESIDPVRFISNHSSGKMGYAIASEAHRRGGDVILISGKTCLKKPYGIKFYPVNSAANMLDEVLEKASNADIIIMAAAVADYTPAEVQSQKIKKKSEDFVINQKKTDDILKNLQKISEKKFIVGFAAETENIIENARKKLIEKGSDMIIANDVSQRDRGFYSEKNEVAILTKDENILKIPLMSKENLAKIIWDVIEDKMTKKIHINATISF